MTRLCFVPALAAGLVMTVLLVGCAGGAAASARWLASGEIVTPGAAIIGDGWVLEAGTPYPLPPEFANQPGASCTQAAALTAQDYPYWLKGGALRVRVKTAQVEEPLYGVFSMCPVDASALTTDRYLIDIPAADVERAAAGDVALVAREMAGAPGVHTYVWALWLSRAPLDGTASPSASPDARTNANTALLTELVTTSLGKEKRFDVLSSRDMRRQLELEANKALLGCDASSSACLAEIAGAMGAQLVVQGTLGKLDDIVVLTLNLYDSAQAKSIGRVAVKEKSLAAVSERVDAAVLELVAGVQHPASGTTRLLVLDVEAAR